MAAGPVGILASGITSDAVAGYQKTRNANPLRSANLPTIDPSEPLALADWLICFEAALPLDHSFILWWAKHPSYLPNNQPPPISIYKAIMKIPPRNAVTPNIQADFGTWTAIFNELNHTVCSCLITLVQWQADPELRGLVTGPAGFQTTKSGADFLRHLVDAANVLNPSVQKALGFDWAQIEYEAYRRTLGQPADVTVFRDTSSSAAVLGHLTRVLTNYESVPSHYAAAPSVFITTILQIIMGDVPALHAWLPVHGDAHA